MNRAARCLPYQRLNIPYHTVTNRGKRRVGVAIEIVDIDADAEVEEGKEKNTDPELFRM